MIKISIDRPQLRDGGTLEHSGTSWQISRIPNFEDRSFYISESLNDQVNLLEFRHAVELASTEALYCRVRYHFNNDEASGWSRVIPVKGDQVGLKQSGNVLITPTVKVNAQYTGDIFTGLILETSGMRRYSGVGGHDSTSWVITDSDNNVVWEREHEQRDKTKIEVDGDMLESDKIYIVKAKHHTDTNAHSNYGKTLLSTNINKANIFTLEPVGPLVPNRRLYFKLFVYLNSYQSVDIIVRDAQGLDVASNLDQVTRTPYIDPIGLIAYQRYTIYARIKYDNGTYSSYVEIDSSIIENNVLINQVSGATYIDKYNFTQEFRTQGETVVSTTELYTGDVLLAKSNDNNLYRHVLCNGKLVEKGSVITLDGMNELMDKPYVNIIPLYDGRVLIDYNAVRLVHINNIVVPANIREHMLVNDLDSYEYESILIVADEAKVATDDIYGGDLVHRPRFSLYDFNTVTNKFTLINTVMRDDELYGTSVTNSLVAMDNNMVYYVPSHSVVGLEDNGIRRLKLMRLDLNDLSITTDSELPVDVRSLATLFKTSNTSLTFMSGSYGPIDNDGVIEYRRSNNDIFEYNIITRNWVNLGRMNDTIPSSTYALAPYVRLDGKVVLFNNVNSGPSCGDQRTILYNPVDRSTVLNNNDTIDDITYRNSIQLLNGDILRLSTRVIDPQLIQTYVSDTYDPNNLHINNMIDIVKNLVVRISDIVTIETLYKFDSITIEGDADDNTGILILLDGNSVTEFKWNDLIVIGDKTIVQDLFINNGREWNSVTILENSSLEVYNVLHVPTNTNFAINAPIAVHEITVGENSDLIINI